MVVATGIGLVVAELLGVGLVSTLAVWATVGIVSVRLYRGSWAVRSAGGRRAVGDLKDTAKERRRSLCRYLRSS